MHQTVNVIFEDPGVQELLVKLYQKGKTISIFDGDGSIRLIVYHL